MLLSARSVYLEKWAESLSPFIGPGEKGKQTGRWPEEKGAEPDDRWAGKLDRHYAFAHLSIMVRMRGY